MLDSRTNGHQLASLPLNNDTVRRRIDEMAIDVKSQLNNILRNTKFSLVLDESAVRDSEALLLGYTRFKQDSKFVEKMLFARISGQNLSGFPLLGKSKPTDNTLQIILKHLLNLFIELNFRFLDLKLMKFPSWIAQFFLFHCTSEEGLAMNCNLIDEILHLQSDEP